MLCFSFSSPRIVLHIAWRDVQWTEAGIGEWNFLGGQSVEYYFHHEHTAAHLGQVWKCSKGVAFSFFKLDSRPMQSMLVWSTLRPHNWSQHPWWFDVFRHQYCTTYCGSPYRSKPRSSFLHPGRRLFHLQTLHTRMTIWRQHAKQNRYPLPYL